jgi:hypothetical protein
LQPEVTFLVVILTTLDTIVYIHVGSNYTITGLPTVTTVSDGCMDFSGAQVTAPLVGTFNITITTGNVTAIVSVQVNAGIPR